MNRFTEYAAGAFCAAIGITLGLYVRVTRLKEDHRP